MKKLFFTLAACFLFSAAQSQTIFGTWQTKDDETGEAKSHVEVFEASGKVYGRITKLLRESADKICEKCPGERYKQPLVSMIIIIDMEMKDGMWQSGEILDPEKGKWYGCKLWLKEGDANTLVVRGTLGPFYRTQYWSRVQ
jgi:uncharacterized protein (DUF2147 family)